ncbi:hypothetical protein DL93DRAFT_2174648 [Clavulina sp. PMI_390]|nr:hypothetical protein DL93DRAFT_2174648 [Clavulina sp. PMI_390]
MDETRDAEHSATQQPQPEYYRLTLNNGSQFVGKLADPQNGKVFHVGVVGSLSLSLSPSSTFPSPCVTHVLPATLLHFIHSIAIGHSGTLLVAVSLEHKHGLYVIGVLIGKW